MKKLVLFASLLSVAHSAFVHGMYCSSKALTPQRLQRLLSNKSSLPKKNNNKRSKQQIVLNITASSPVQQECSCRNNQPLSTPATCAEIIQCYPYISRLPQNSLIRQICAAEPQSYLHLENRLAAARHHGMKITASRRDYVTLMLHDSKYITPSHLYQNFPVLLPMALINILFLVTKDPSACFLASTICALMRLWSLSDYSGKEMRTDRSISRILNNIPNSMYHKELNMFVDLSNTLYNEWEQEQPKNVEQPSVTKKIRLKFDSYIDQLATTEKETIKDQKTTQQSE